MRSIKFQILNNMLSKNIAEITKYRLVEFGESRKEPVNPFIVPNVGAIARKMTGGSQIAIIIKSLLSLGLVNKFRFAWNNLPFALSILKMDFAAGVKVLCELEVLKAMEKDKTNHFVLHYQMTDMALAFKNKRVLLYFFYLGKKYNFIPGIISNNPVKMLSFLGGFVRLPKDLVVYIPGKSLKGNVLEAIELSNINFVGI